jgi:hypothetical protein
MSRSPMRIGTGRFATHDIVENNRLKGRDFPFASLLKEPRQSFEGASSETEGIERPFTRPVS